MARRNQGNDCHLPAECGAGADSGRIIRSEDEIPLQAGKGELDDLRPKLSASRGRAENKNTCLCKTFSPINNS